MKNRNTVKIFALVPDLFGRQISPNFIVKCRNWSLELEIERNNNYLNSKCCIEIPLFAQSLQRNSQSPLPFCSKVNHNYIVSATLNKIIPL